MSNFSIRQTMSEKTVLFSCFGTTDPVRDYRDGPLLHIVRHYRPSLICVFFSREMKCADGGRGFAEKMVEHIHREWNCDVAFQPVFTEIDDPSDLDVLSKPMTEAFEKLVADCPDGRVLLNLSSGTPQMKFILAQWAVDSRYPRTLGIQVKNPQKKSGDTDRTNKEDYDVEEQLQLNEDEDPGAPNRCVVPELFHLVKQQKRHEICTLLQNYHYSAVAEMTGSLPPVWMNFVRYLNARAHLDIKNTLNYEKQVNVPFPLCSPRGTGRDADYEEAVEYYLILKNMQKTGRLTDFVLRLNPLIVRLQRRALDCSLGYGVREIMVRSNGREKLSRYKLEQKSPAILSAVDAKLAQQNRGPFHDTDPNVDICNLILEQLDSVPAEVTELFRVYEPLNRSQRNAAAHSLTSVSEKAIRESCSKDSRWFICQIERCFPLLYPQCKRDVFSVYERCNDYLLEKLNVL